MAAKIIAGFLLLPLTKAIKNSCSTAMAKNTKDEWTPAYAYAAVLAGKPNIALPARDLGFKRSAKLTNLCAPTSFPSNLFKLEKAAETFVATTAASQSIQLTLDAATCALTGISLYKTGHVSPQREVELRLQFGKCTGGPSGLQAGVVMGVERDPLNAPSAKLLPWVQEVNDAAAPAPAAAPTPPPSQQLQVTTEDIAQPVGVGKCNADEIKTETANLQTTCQSKCKMMREQADAGVGTKCTGFAFSADSKSCILYKDAVTTSNNAVGWLCTNMTTSIANSQVVEETTTVPLTTSTKAPQAVSIDFTQVLQASQTSTVIEISPPADEPTCFNPVWWLQLEDRKGKPTSMLLPSVDYDQLLKLLKVTTVSDSSKMKNKMSAPRVMDRILVDSCSHIQWDGTICHVKTPTFSDPACTSEAMANGILTGLLTALVTWIIVGLVFYIMTGHLRRSDGFERLESKVCTAQIVLSLSCVALVGAGASGFGLMQLFNEMLRSQMCFDFDETLVIMLSASLSSGLAIVIILQYIFRAHPSHPHPAFIGPPPKTDKPYGHLALVEVEDGVPVIPGQTIPGDRPAPTSAMVMDSFRSGSDHYDDASQGGFASWTNVITSTRS